MCIYIYIYIYNKYIYICTYTYVGVARPHRVPGGGVRGARRRPAAAARRGRHAPDGDAGRVRAGAGPGALRRGRGGGARRGHAGGGRPRAGADLEASREQRVRPAAEGRLAASRRRARERGRRVPRDGAERPRGARFFFTCYILLILQKYTCY